MSHCSPDLKKIHNRPCTLTLNLALNVNCDVQNPPDYELHTQCLTCAMCSWVRRQKHIVEVAWLRMKCPCALIQVWIGNAAKAMLRWIESSSDVPPILLSGFISFPHSASITLHFSFLFPLRLKKPTLEPFLFSPAGDLFLGCSSVLCSVLLHRHIDFIQLSWQVQTSNTLSGIWSRLLKSAPLQKI